MESKLKGTVNYLQNIDCTIDAPKQNEESQNSSPVQQQQEAYLDLPLI